MYCSNCGEQVATNTRFCGACGSVTAVAPVPVQMQVLPAVPQAAQFVHTDVQAKLRTYDRYKTMQCPQCGYRGSVGWIDTTTPGGWFTTLLGVIFIFIPLGWIILTWKYLDRKHVCECPNCSFQFAVEPGLKPDWDVVTRA